MSSSQKKDTGGKKNATKEGADTEHSDTKKSTTTPQEQAESLLPPLEVLEEDDDFQEFGEEGKGIFVLDWEWIDLHIR